jgi:hypothetical protein
MTPVAPRVLASRARHSVEYYLHITSRLGPTATLQVAAVLTNQPISLNKA